MRIPLLSLLLTLPIAANPNDFRELLADPATRSEALTQLIPGTRDWFFHHARHQQLLADWPAYDQTMQAWQLAIQDKKRPVPNDGFQSLKTRALLLRYESDPDRIRTDLIADLDLSFDDTRPDAREIERLPDTLDPALITRAAFDKRAAKEFKQPWGSFSPRQLLASLDDLDTFTPAQINDALNRLNRADHPQALNLVIAGLKLKPPVRFGKASLHARLTLDQMRQLKRIEPDVLTSESFAIQYLTRLRTGSDSAYTLDPALQAAHLSACYEFTRALAPALNELKAHVLFHHLRLQRQLGNHSEADFLAYLALPRRNHPILRKCQPLDRDKAPSLKKDFSAATGCPPVRDDTELIKSLLNHFLGKTANPDAYAEFLPTERLTRLHARAKLLAGADPDRWGRDLKPQEFAELLEETRLDFAPGLPSRFNSRDAVSLPLQLKNTPDLLVRIFELDLPGHLKRHGRQPRVSIDLDGLVPHHQRSLTFPQPPLRLHTEELELPELDGPGAWIVECVSRGRSCRALIRKGTLNPYVEPRSKGQLIHVFNEDGRRVTDASLTLGLETFKPDDQGRFLIPYTEAYSPTEGILTRGKIAETVSLDSRADDFELVTRIHIDREQLRADARATARIELRLLNHQRAQDLARLENPTLTLSATLVSGVTTEHIVSENLTLAPIFTVPFQVPADTVSLQLRLTANLIPHEDSDPVKLETSERFHFNSLLKGGFLHAQITRSPEEYLLEIRGRNGEPLPNQAVGLTFRHHDFNELSIPARLRSDDAGLIHLGPLEQIKFLTAVHEGETIARFSPPSLAARLQLSRPLNLGPGETVDLPLDPAQPDLNPLDYSLLELGIDNRPRADLFARLSVSNQRLIIRGLPPGLYDLRMPSNSIRIEVSAAKPRAKLLVTPTRVLPHHHPIAPSLSKLARDADNITLQLAGVTPDTRVHLIGTRFHHPGDGRPLRPFDKPLPPSLQFGFTPSEFLTDRQLDSETRYILDRRTRKALPGTMLPRAGTLIHRWSQEEIEHKDFDGSDGLHGSPKSSPSKKSQYDGDSDPFAAGGGGDDNRIPNLLDYLARSSELLYDLKPQPDGTLTVPAATFKDCRILHVHLTGPGGISRSSHPLPASTIPLRDRRLTRPLDPQKNHIGTRRAAALAADAEATIENILDADWRAFTTLSEAHEFLYGATGSEQVRDFAFILDWPQFDQKTRLGLWSDHACHELNLFLARVDPKFFAQYVKPSLAEKSEPTFIDHLLLGHDLTPYLRPYAWNRLNAAEKALLASPTFRPAPDQVLQSRIVKELSNRWLLESPTPEQEIQLFTQTLRGTDLATRDSLGLARASQLGRSPFQATGGTTAIINKLKQIIIPVLNFENTSVEEAIDFLRVTSIAGDSGEIDPDKKGLSFFIRKPRTRSGDGLGGNQGPSGTDRGSPRIRELRLRNVSIFEALNYICETTRLRWRVGRRAIEILPATETGEDLFTRTFNVPPDFLARITEGHSPPPSDDPFASSANNGSALKPRMSITDALKSNGINFPPDAKATFDPATSTLIIRNTPTNLDLIESINNATVMSRTGGSGGGALGGADGIFPVTPATPTGFDDPFSGGASPDEDLVFSDSDGFEPPELPNSVGGGFRFFGRPSWSASRSQTRLWMESNYYRHRGRSDENLIPLNAFWLDLAKWDGNSRFLSPNFNACTSSPNEALMCLALLDLPFKAERPKVEVDGNRLRIKARDPMLLFYKDTRETNKLAADSPVLVRQTFHRLDDRFRNEGGRRIENTITGDFLSGVAYGTSLVITNPSGAGRRIDVLAQIPAGAIPIKGLATTLSATRELKPYGVLSLDMAFYFPAPGDFSLYPMKVAEADTILASAPLRAIRVVSNPAATDQATWTAIARDASNDRVLAFLETANLHDLDLAKLRWRLRDRDFFLKTTALLRRNLVHSQTVSAWGLFHGNLPAMRNWFENSNELTGLGTWLDSPLLEIRPTEHGHWQSLEFAPLINPRAHNFDDYPRLSFDAALHHYHAFLDQLAWKPALEANDQLHLTAFLFLQDRTAEALDRFTRIQPDQLTGTLAYDYLHALTLFHRSKPSEAKLIARRHRDLPPGPWRERFDAVIAQSDEIRSLAEPIETQPENPQQNAPSLDIALAPDGRLHLTHQGLKETTLRLYKVDLEMLFSKNPFLEDTSDLPDTRPNEVGEIKLTGTETFVELPEDFRQGNLLVAAESGTTSLLQVLASRDIEIRRQPLDNTLQILDPERRTPLPACYVKVYREEDGEPVFHKDGYTDLRGKFDYRSLTDGAAKTAAPLAIFISHPDRGARTLILDTP